MEDADELDNVSAPAKPLFLHQDLACGQIGPQCWLEQDTTYSTPEGGSGAEYMAIQERWDGWSDRFGRMREAPL